MVPGPRRHLLRQPPTQAEAGSARGEPEVDLPLGQKTDVRTGQQKDREQQRPHRASTSLLSFPFLPTRPLFDRFLSFQASPNFFISL